MRGRSVSMRLSATARLRSLCGCIVVVVAALASCAPIPPSPPAAATQMLPVVRPVPPDPRVGAVFVDGSDLHMCSGAVLDSPAADLMLTAAHCLADAVDSRFVPGLENDTAAGEGWQIDAVYLDPRWIADQDPAADVAVARVSRADGARLESVVGGGLRLGSTPLPGAAVTVVGYPAGLGGGPAACRVPVGAEQQGFPELHCDGVVDGFSGAPWIDGSTVTGLIGGLDGGGCADEVSYSPPFGAAVGALISRAESGGTGDDAPALFDDGCG